MAGNIFDQFDAQGGRTPNGGTTPPNVNVFDQFDPSAPIGGSFGNNPIVGLADAGIAGANQFVVGGLGAAARTANRALGLVGWTDGQQQAENDINAAQQAFTYHPQTAAGQRIANAVSGIVAPVARTVGTVAGAVVGDENVPAVLDGLATLGFRGPSQALSTAARGVIPGLAEASQTLSEARATDQAATASGQATLGLRTGSPLAQFIEKQSARLWGGGPVREAAQASNDQLGITAKEIINNLSGGADTSQQGVGQVLSNQLKTAAERSRDVSREGYEKVASMLPDGATVPVARTQELLQKLTDIPGASATAQTIVPSDIRALAGALAKDAGEEGVLPYEALRALRTNIGQQIDWNPFSSAGPSNGLYKAIYGAIGRDLDEGAASFGDDVAQQIKANSTAYAQAAAQRNALSSIINRAGGPEKIYSALFNSAQDGSTPLNAVLSNVDPATRKLLAASALERMGRATAGVQNAAGDVFSADRLLTNWNKLSPQARSSLFGGLPGGYGDSIQQLVDNAGKLKAYGRVLDARGDGSLSSFTHIGAVAEAAMHGLPGWGSLVAGIGANRALALALTNPSTAWYLARATGEMAGRGASYLGRVYQSSAPSGPAQGPATQGPLGQGQQ